MKKAIVLIACALIFTGLKTFGQVKTISDTQTKIPNSETIHTFWNDGAWCWFSDPRAIYYDDNLIITGWVKKDGSVEVASLNPKSGEKKFNIIFPQLEMDDHDNPAFVV